LWAFAAITAVDFGIVVNNRLCTNETSEWYYGCSYRTQEPDCKVSKPREWNFRTGRRDCTHPGVSDSRPYWHDVTEVHPNPHGSGDETVEFFKTSFGLSVRESAAIMGAHTYGRMNVRHTLFRYGWTSHNMPLFNNHYYRAMVGQSQWYVPGSSCKEMGDAYGGMPTTEWRLKAERDCEGGGPVQWIMFQNSCPDCDPASSFYGGDHCCKDVPQDMECHEQCAKPRFVPGKDLTMLNADMGLYRQFDLAEGWRPTGCPGLEQFNLTGWSKKFQLIGNTNHINPHLHVDWSASPTTYPLCLTAQEEAEKNAPVVARLCENVNGDTGKWEEDFQNGEIVLKHHPDLRLCAEHVPDSEHENMRVLLRDASFMACHWTYDARYGRLAMGDDWCLGIEGKENLGGDFSLSMVPCQPNSDQINFGVYNNYFAGGNEFQWASPTCPLQERSDSPGEKPLHLIVEEFAEYQDFWIGEFMLSLEKVLENGYTSGDLIQGPSLDGVVCTFPEEDEDEEEEWVCFQES